MRRLVLGLAGRWPYILAGAVLFLAGVGVAVGISRAQSSSQALSVKGQIEGSVVSVTPDGSGFCIRSDADTQQHCSQPMQVPGSPILKVGNRVTVTDAFVDLGGGSSIEVYIVTSPAPPHG